MPHLAAARPRHRTHTGTRISFTLSEPATVRIVFARAHVRKRLTLVVHGHAGRNVLRFGGRLSRHRRLRAGRYTLRVTASDAIGATSAPRALRVTVLPRRHRHR